MANSNCHLHNLGYVQQRIHVDLRVAIAMHSIVGYDPNLLKVRISGG